MHVQIVQTYTIISFHLLNYYLPKKYLSQQNTHLLRNINLLFQNMDMQALDIDFNGMDFSKKGSPKSSMVEPIYGNNTTCELNDNSETLLGALTVNGTNDMFASNGLTGADRLSGDYDINSVLPPPKTRELAIGESYSDMGKYKSKLKVFKLSKSRIKNGRELQ